MGVSKREYTPFHRNHIPAQGSGEERKTGRKKKWIPLIIAASVLLAAFWFFPQSVLKEGAPAGNVTYTVSAIYSPASHDREVYLYDEDVDFAANDPGEHYVLTDAMQDQLESLLQAYDMRRTLRYDRQLKTYNIYRIGENPAFLDVYAGEDEVMVNRGIFWYRITQPEQFYSDIQALIDGYLLECKESPGTVLTDSK